MPLLTHHTLFHKFHIVWTPQQLQFNDRPLLKT